MTFPSLGRRTFCQQTAAIAAGMLMPGWKLSAEETVGEPAPLPYVPGSFTLAVLPDTQVYCESFPQHFYNQTQWIVDNAAKRDIRFVLQLGDITNRNTREQWEVAKRAMGTLAGKVPYAMVPGNHDYGPGGNAANRDTYLNEYFSFEAEKARPNFGGALDEGLLENTYHTFRAADHDYLIVGLEWSPRDRAVEWANKVVAEHPNHRAILITHAYMYSDETRYDWQKFGNKQPWNPHEYGTAKFEGGTNDGEELWQKLVSKHPNFIMTLNGHVLNDGLARLTSEAAPDHPVYQMLVNYQMHHEGGEGYMRLVEFLPDDRTIQVKAYSPSLDRYKTDEQNQFVLKRSTV